LRSQSDVVVAVSSVAPTRLTARGSSYCEAKVRGAPLRDGCRSLAYRSRKSWSLSRGVRVGGLQQNLESLKREQQQPLSNEASPRTAKCGRCRSTVRSLAVGGAAGRTTAGHAVTDRPIAGPALPARGPLRTSAVEPGATPAALRPDHKGRAGRPTRHGGFAPQGVGAVADPRRGCTRTRSRSTRTWHNCQRPSDRGSLVPADSTIATS